MKHYLAIAAALAIAPVFASAQVVQGDREVTLSGSGFSDDSFDSTTLSVGGSFAHYMTPQTAVGVRQAIDFIDLDNGSDWAGRTALFGQWHFGDAAAAVRPFVGFNIGGLYGDNVDNTFSGGPELGAKFYVQPRTFVLAHVDYQVRFESADDVEERWDDGTFFYNLGVGYNF